MIFSQTTSGQVKSIVSVTLLTCPWYEISQKERGEQARHNILLVVFLSHDRQFFSPANPQAKEKASVIDLVSELKNDTQQIKVQLIETCFYQILSIPFFI